MAAGTIKTNAQLQAQIDAGIKANGNREITPAIHNAIEQNIVASKLNIRDGGNVIEVLTGYTTDLTPSDYKHLTPKKYVDDLAAAYLPLAGGAMSGNITFANALGIDSTTLGDTLNIGATNALILKIGRAGATTVVVNKIGFGGTPSAAAHFILPNDPTPLGKTAWTDVDVIFGQIGTNGKALGVSYTTATNTINLNFLEPSVQWLNAQFNFGSLGFYSGGGVLGFYQSALGKVGINTSSLASGALLTIRGTDNSNDDYQLRTFDFSGSEIFTLRNDRRIMANGNPIYFKGDGSSVGDLRVAYDSATGELQAQKWNGVIWEFNTLI